jgi:hypothetical protein
MRYRGASCAISRRARRKPRKLPLYEAIRPALEARGYGVALEESGWIKSRNIIVGDVREAKIIVTAHYDTCAQLPFPNYIFPQRIGVYIAWQLLIAAACTAACLIFQLAVYALTGRPSIASLSGFAALALCLLLMIAGKANRHTCNDNTSGVVTVLETALSLPEAQRKNAAFVLFDNEEPGMLGSSRFAKIHRDETAGKPLMNFDCVSDGDTVLLIPDKLFKADRRLYEALSASFRSTGEKRVYISERQLFYPSDQMMFKKTVGIAAMKQSKRFGLYLDRIHTARDTVFDEDNIDLIREALIGMVNRIGV